MLITRDQTIVGLPAVDARDLMRQLMHDSMSARRLAESAGQPDAEAELFVSQLVDAGLIQPRPYGQLDSWSVADDDEYEAARREELTLWTTTVAGNALAKARLGKKITRAKAEALVAELLERVEQSNTDHDMAFLVDQVLVYGSYLDQTADHVSDVDLIVHYSRRASIDYRFWHRARIDDAKRQGRTFRSHIDRELFPSNEFYRFLRGRSNRLDIQFVPDGQVEHLPPGVEQRRIYPPI